MTQDWATTAGDGTALPSRARRSAFLVAAHMTLRSGVWYWRRRLPSAITGGTSTASRFSTIRLSLRTRDRQPALARARQLDALLERTAVMNAPGTVTAAEFAGLARTLMQSVLEVSRARRARDLVLSAGKDIEAKLNPGLAYKLLDFILEIENPVPDDEANSINLSPADGKGGPIYLPEDLAASIMSAVASAPQAEHLKRHSALAAAQRRAQTALGRAIMAKRALITNDGALARDLVTNTAASAGVTIALNCPSFSGGRLV